MNCGSRVFHGAACGAVGNSTLVRDCIMPPQVPAWAATPSSSARIACQDAPGSRARARVISHPHPLFVGIGQRTPWARSRAQFRLRPDSRSSCRRLEHLPTEIGGIGGEAPQTLMRSYAVIEVEVDPDRALRLGDRAVSVQVDFLVFEAAPQPLNEYVIPPAPASVHADADTAGFEHP